MASTNGEYLRVNASSIIGGLCAILISIVGWWVHQVDGKVDAMSLTLSGEHGILVRLSNLEQSNMDLRSRPVAVPEQHVTVEPPRPDPSIANLIQTMNKREDNRDAENRRWQENMLRWMREKPQASAESRPPPIPPKQAPMTLPSASPTSWGDSYRRPKDQREPYAPNGGMSMPGGTAAPSVSGVVSGTAAGVGGHL